MAEREEPNREPNGPTKPADLAPPISGSMASPTREAADNRRATQAGIASRRTPMRIRARLRSLWPR
jgi:hypothetical protein